MHSPRRPTPGRCAWLGGWALLLALQSGVGLAQAEPAPTPSREEVGAVVARLRTDPNLPGTRKEKSLQFKESLPDESPDASPDKPSSDAPNWLSDLVEWVAEAGRVLMWVLGALAVVFLLVGLRHWVKARAEGAMAGSRLLPSHVRDLDIRPESLPDQIGAAASALWLRGEHRAALSLLYRGALSRLVHDHGVPVRAASTEGECVRLAAARLDAQRSGFFERLVSAWQAAVYGAHMPESASVLSLCADFDVHLGAARPAAGGPV